MIDKDLFTLLRCLFVRRVSSHCWLSRSSLCFSLLPYHSTVRSVRHTTDSMGRMKRRGTLDDCEFQPRSLSTESDESPQRLIQCKKWRRRANNSMQQFFKSIDRDTRFTMEDLPLINTIQTRRASFYVTVTHGVTILLIGGTTLAATIAGIILLVDLTRI